MHKWIKRLHIYSGLLNFTILVVFALVGLAATLLPPPSERPKPEPAVRYLDFRVPENLDDRQVADLVYSKLDLPLTRPASDWAVGRDSDNNLSVRLGTPGRRHQAVFLETEGRIRLETIPADTWQFLTGLHEMTPSWAHPDWRTQAWAYYVEFSIWSLTWMAVSGVYLWLVSRPRFRWAQISFVAGLVVLAGFLILVR